ncbi:GGDEF domain-containing protein [Paramaledivibacter caminithermalis]|jgi:diguanylate cyclase (GGDEF)-like protein|uniref:Diguanylate cyclase (GGDEF) domain-containing protein n=1 Tax=Paramaledivibacter caminithermalis (strain DSM 15212 / CIP 107654 / DViRD3) TaxID=1121301 RepID=A0A1M6QD35_PARC5|nr:GGDEF domain-containing protein [Paramaledivibacter caminithermalis]SHK18098.1 diguanylate cyclase (GGDEF) domain-containing protein [Paramaledivibacter caminithermalis DSM 15212]
MMRSVSEIMLKNFRNINLLDGVKKAQDFVINEGIDYFPVIDQKEIVGILTYRDLIKAHPNRIVADAMNDTIISISSSASIWEAKEIFDNNDIDAVLIIDNEELTGIITRNLLYAELGKHTDLLTGLYKTDYIYYHTRKLISSKKNPAIIFIDVNNFGYIDKKYGHIQGDIILKEIASILKQSMNSETFLCRFGGDEFTILTPYDLDRCINFTKKILSKISNYNFINNIKINVSAGIALNSHEADCSDIISIIYDLINRASLASTKAKKEKHSYHIAEDDKVYSIS